MIIPTVLRQSTLALAELWSALGGAVGAGGFGSRGQHVFEHQHPYLGKLFRKPASLNKIIMSMDLSQLLLFREWHEFRQASRTFPRYYRVQATHSGIENLLPTYPRGQPNGCQSEMATWGVSFYL